MTAVANTGFMARTVLLVGFPGVQALDLVGPFEVFTGASLYADARTAGTGYDVRIVAVGGTPVATGTGLTLVADPLPDPGEPVDTVVLPGGRTIVSRTESNSPSSTIAGADGHHL